MSKHRHYKKDVSHLQFIDVYRVLELFGVTSPARQHAIKKLLCAGQRGVKDLERDLREAVDSVHRELQMIAEDCNGAPSGQVQTFPFDPIGLPWPDGAGWFAQDADGEGRFFQCRPTAGASAWFGLNIGKSLNCGEPTTAWRDTLIERQPALSRAPTMENPDLSRLPWPDGGNWFARNADGQGWFYLECPDLRSSDWKGVSIGASLPGTPSIHWQQHVFKRPD